MRKLCIMFVLACILLCGCGKSNIPEETTNAPEETTNAPEETTNAPEETTSAPEVIENKWEVIHLADEFGDETDKMALATSCVGTFSNTATSKADLLVKIVLIPAMSTDYKYAAFDFYLMEYNDHAATYLSGDKIVFKAKIGESIYEEEISGNAPNGAVSIVNSVQYLQYSAVYPRIYNALVENTQNIRCIIEIGSSKYNFTLTGENFVEASDEMMHTAGFNQFDTSKNLMEIKE